MTRWLRRAIKCAAVLMALLFVATPLHMALAHAQAVAEPVKIRVEVTDGGFQPETIEVEQGQLVEITFVWAHEAYVQEEHIMVLEGYKLETDKITSEHRESTFKFVADKVGSFNFKCDLECDTHDFLQKGSLKIKAGAGGTAPAGAASSGGSTSALTPTSVTLNSSALTAGGPVTLTAVLRDAGGTPVPKAEVGFYVEADFVGTKSEMEVGRAKTDPQGVATMNYLPTIDASKLKVTARFEGVGIYSESQQAIEIAQNGAPTSAYTEAPIGLENAPTFVWLGSGSQNRAASVWSWSINHWGPLTIFLVVFGVWLTLAYVLYQVHGISRVSAGR